MRLPEMPEMQAQRLLSPDEYLREMFYLNRGRIQRDLLQDALTSVRSEALNKAWRRALSERLVVADGGDYVWPVQEWMFKRLDSAGIAC